MHNFKHFSRHLQITLAQITNFHRIFWHAVQTIAIWFLQGPPPKHKHKIRTLGGHVLSSYAGRGTCLHTFLQLFRHTGLISLLCPPPLNTNRGHPTLTISKVNSASRLSSKVQTFVTRFRDGQYHFNQVRVWIYGFIWRCALDWYFLSSLCTRGDVLLLLVSGRSGEHTLGFMALKRFSSKLVRLRVIMMVLLLFEAGNGKKLKVFVLLETELFTRRLASTTWKRITCFLGLLQVGHRRKVTE